MWKRTGLVYSSAQSLRDLVDRGCDRDGAGTNGVRSKSRERAFVHRCKVAIASLPVALVCSALVLPGPAPDKAPIQQAAPRANEPHQWARLSPPRLPGPCPASPASAAAGWPQRWAQPCSCWSSTPTAAGRRRCCRPPTLPLASPSPAWLPHQMAPGWPPASAAPSPPYTCGGCRPRAIVRRQPRATAALRPHSALGLAAAYQWWLARGSTTLALPPWPSRPAVRSQSLGRTRAAAAPPANPAPAPTHPPSTHPPTPPRLPGRLLASTGADRDRQLMVWDPSSGRQLGRSRGKEQFDALTLPSDSLLLAINRQELVRLAGAGGRWALPACSAGALRQVGAAGCSPLGTHRAPHHLTPAPTSAPPLLNQPSRPSSPWSDAARRAVARSSSPATCTRCRRCPPPRAWWAWCRCRPPTRARRPAWWRPQTAASCCACGPARLSWRRPPMCRWVLGLECVLGAGALGWPRKRQLETSTHHPKNAAPTPPSRAPRCWL